jgi:hypothetical protein
VGTEPVDFCRELEAYLCKKNDGHLIRVTGPSFDVVSGWAAQGIPLKVACAGIDRYFERYYRKGPRRRPVKIDFCDADVLDVFDEWRKAVGVAASVTVGVTTESRAALSGPPDKPRGPSLPAHLERVVLKLTAARANGRLGDEFDGLIDRVSRELDTARAAAGGVRGDARHALIARLSALDAELLQGARAALTDTDFSTLTAEATDELASFRERLTADAFARARDGAVSRLVRERFGLPTMTFL